MTDEVTKIKVIKANATWFPLIGQILVIEHFKNTSTTARLHSAWIGCTAPLLNLPFILWRMLVRPFFISVKHTLSLILYLGIHGVKGNLVGVRLDSTTEVIKSEQIANKE